MMIEWPSNKVFNSKNKFQLSNSFVFFHMPSKYNVMKSACKSAEASFNSCCCLSGGPQRNLSEDLRGGAGPWWWLADGKNKDLPQGRSLIKGLSHLWQQPVPNGSAFNCLSTQMYKAGTLIDPSFNTDLHRSVERSCESANMWKLIRETGCTGLVLQALIVSICFSYDLISSILACGLFLLSDLTTSWGSKCEWLLWNITFGKM